MKKEKFFLSVYTENRSGLLNRVTTTFVKRHLNIESITCCESEVEGVFRYTIELITTRENMRKLAGQLEKQVDVVKAYFHGQEEVIMQEIALYKITPEFLYKKDFQGLLREQGGAIMHVDKEFAVIEKRGTQEETQKLHNDLAEYGLLQFVRSGRVAITRPAMPVSELLKNT